jgi:predicted dienelactone hydrolase
MTEFATPGPSPIVSVKPIVLPSPERYVDLQVKVSAPVTGTDLPIIVLSHGFGSSLDGYAPWPTSGPRTAS